MEEASRYLAELAHRSLREINDAVEDHKCFLRGLIEEAEAELAAVLISSQQQQEQEVGATAWPVCTAPHGCTVGLLLVVTNNISRQLLVSTNDTVHQVALAVLLPLASVSKDLILCCRVLPTNALLNPAQMQQASLCGEPS
jgi:hypothetical protein